MLLRHYLSLNGRMVCFNIHSDFNNSLEGLIIVDVRRTDPKTGDALHGRRWLPEVLFLPQTGRSRLNRMKKLLALLQILGALALTGLAALVIVDMTLNARMPDTISVVNLLVGSVVLIGCLLAIARFLVRKGLAGLRARED